MKSILDFNNDIYYYIYVKLLLSLFFLLRFFLHSQHHSKTLPSQMLLIFLKVYFFYTRCQSNLPRATILSFRLSILNDIFDISNLTSAINNTFNNNNKFISFNRMSLKSLCFLSIIRPSAHSCVYAAPYVASFTRSIKPHIVRF